LGKTHPRRTLKFEIFYVVVFRAKIRSGFDKADSYLGGRESQIND